LPLNLVAAHDIFALADSKFALSAPIFCEIFSHYPRNFCPVPLMFLPSLLVSDVNLREVPCTDDLGLIDSKIKAMASG
jgi:hypothetical protein